MDLANSFHLSLSPNLISISIVFFTFSEVNLNLVVYEDQPNNWVP